jgi:long-chain fatty acid transport protein
MLGFLREKAAVRNLAPGGDGQVKYQDYTPGVGGDIGIMLQPDKKTRVGITYLTPMDLSFSSIPHFRNTGPILITLLRRRGFLSSPVDLSLTVPQEVMVGVYRQVTENMALLGSANWQNWSQFGLVGIGINSSNPKSLTTNLNYDDTWQIAAGMQYKVSPEFMFSAGFAYDSSMLSDGNRTVSAPVASQYRYAFGGQYQWNEHLRTGVAYEFLWMGKMPLQQSRQTGTTLSGQFTNTLINFFGLNLAYVF